MSKKAPLFMKLKKDLQRDGWSSKSVVALLLFGAIVVVFVFFGYSHQTLGSGAAAQVGSTLITPTDLRTETNRVEQMYAPMFGGGAGMGEAQRQFLRQQALENLISSELMAQGAERAGIIVPDQEIRDVIINEIPAFQEEGKFQRDRYQAVLAANNMTKSEFEARIRKDRSTSRIRKLLELTAAPLDLELAKAKELRENKRNVDFVKLDRTSVQESMPVSPEDIQKRLSDADFAKKVQEDFEKNKAQYGSEEEVKAQHILIKTQAGSEESEKAALEKIKQIQKRAQTEDFGQLASEVSEDQGSKVNKGELGSFGHGKMVPEFEKAAFSQKVGVVGEPVKSAFGYHLIKVNEHKAAKEPKFEDARNTIARKLIAGEKYDDLVKSLEAALDKGDTESAQKLISQMGLHWEETGFFEWGAETAPKIGSAAATLQALEVSEKHPWPKKVARDGGSLYIVKWKADKKEPIPAGEKLKDSIARERSYDLLSGWLDAMKATTTIERNNGLLQSARQ